MPHDTEVLLVRGNGIMSFHEQLPSLVRLQQVDLSHNRIGTLGIHPTFENLTSMLSLNLGYNQLRALLHESFRGLVGLRELRLTHNHIHSIEDHSFDGLQSLEVLDLTSNELLSVSRHWFEALPNLQELILDDNQIGSLINSPFQPLKKLSKLSLHANFLQALNKATFRGLESLQTLDMNYNRFEKVPTRAFTIFKRLKFLSLDGNPVASLDGADFRDFAVAKISMNFLPDLELVDRESFSNLPELTSLQLHDNPRLAFIDEEAFVNLPKLRTLYVHNNHLLALPQTLLDSLPSLEMVSFYNNPIRCDCNSYFIKLLINNTHLHDSSIHFSKPDKLKCDSPPALSNQLLRDVPLEDFPVTCPPTAIPFFNDSYQRELGDSIKYECRAIGVTQPHIHWILSNGKAVNNTSNFSRVRLGAKGSLEIHHLKPIDAGTYTCVATDEYGYDTTSTVLRIHSSNIHILYKGVATNFITVTWNGTDSTISTSDYLIMYRQKGSEEDFGMIHLKPYMRAYTITNLLPETTYEFCIAYEHMEQVVKLHCIDLTTKHRMYVMAGIKTVGNMAVVIPVTVTLSFIVLFCVGVTAMKRWRRRKAYKEPEGVTINTHAGAPKMGNMSQIPLDNLYHPPSTPICTSRTSLIGHSNA